MQTPRYIFADDFSAFETFFKSVPGRRCSFKKGDSLWAPGQPFSPVYYILSGLALTCIHHEEGHRKILSFHGKGTVFPVYHSNRFKIEKSIVTQALEDVEALEFSPSQFRRMMEERFPLTETVIDWYASYVNLLLYETAHQEYNSAFIELCNLLYLLAERGDGGGPSDLSEPGGTGGYPCCQPGQSFQKSLSSPAGGHYCHRTEADPHPPAGPAGSPLLQRDAVTAEHSRPAPAVPDITLLLHMIIIHEIRRIVCSPGYREYSDFSVIQKRDVL